MLGIIQRRQGSRQRQHWSVCRWKLRHLLYTPAAWAAWLQNEAQRHRVAAYENQLQRRITHSASGHRLQQQLRPLGVQWRHHWRHQGGVHNGKRNILASRQPPASQVGHRSTNPSKSKGQIGHVINRFCSHRLRCRAGLHIDASLLSSSTVWCQRQLAGKQANRMTHWLRVHGLAASAGVWLRATELEISAVPWAFRFGKGFAFFSVRQKRKVYNSRHRSSVQCTLWVRKKQDTTHVDDFVKYWSIFKILSLLD